MVEPMRTPSRVVRLILLPALIGSIAALGAISFYWLLELAKSYFLEYLAGYHPGGAQGEAPLFEFGKGTDLTRWLLLVIPFLGGLVSGFLVYWLAPEAEGHGTDAAIEAYHRHGGNVRARVPFVKAVSSALTIGTGGSGGREGPIAQIGAGMGSIVSKWFHLSAKDRRVLLIAGLSGGIGSIFRAPMAGALFGAEVLYRRMELEGEVLVPATISSIIAYTIFSSKFGYDRLFTIPHDLEFQTISELVPYTVLALCMVVGAFLYAETFYLVRGLFRKMPGPPHIRPAIGGLVVGLIGCFGLTEALGGGYGVIQDALLGNLTWQLLIGVAGLKILTTCFTIGSGGSGGMFGPSIVIGGAFGGAVGMGIQQLMPHMAPYPESFVIVGMAGFFSACANTPISTVIMVTEMTGSYHLLLPTLWVCTITYVLLPRTTIYETQPADRLDSPVHLHEMIGETLKRIRVDEAMDSAPAELITLQRSTPLKRILPLFSSTTQEVFPVVTGEGKLIGAVTSRGLRAAAGESGILDLVVAEDLAVNLPRVAPDDDLLFVAQLMASEDTDEVFVMESQDSEKLVGILFRRQVLAAHAKHAMEA